jgi:uncharacterized iron-regulated membrane protein
VLLVCFFFGSLSVFDREIDRWAIPSTRFAAMPMPSFDKVLRPQFEAMQPSQQSLDHLREHAGVALPDRFDTVRSWSAYTTHRDPVPSLSASWEVPHAKSPELEAWAQHAIDPRTGHLLPQDQLKIGSQFFYPMHYGLHLEWQGLGVWIVGLAALVMLVALVSGLVLHRKIFREFFTFRPWKSTQRSVLDLHNMTGILAFPFHFMFAYTGLLIFVGIYFPLAQTQLKPLHELHERMEEGETGLPLLRSGQPAPLASVDAMVQEAKRRWAARDMAGEVGLLQVLHVGDANSYVSVFRAGCDRVALLGEGIHFLASTGEVVHEDPPRTVVSGISEFLVGLHLQHFEHWLLRWLYGLGGLMGCVCLATGYVFFVEKRKAKHEKAGDSGVRWVDAFAVTTVTGMLIATVGMLVANRAIPENLPNKGSWEQWAFWSLWLLAMVHAFLRGIGAAPGRVNPAWREQCAMLSALSVAAVLLNAVTTGDHLLKTLFMDRYWPVAGVDVSLLATAGVAGWTARKLARRAQDACQHPGGRGSSGGASTRTGVKHG